MFINHKKKRQPVGGSETSINQQILEKTSALQPISAHFPADPFSSDNFVVQTGGPIFFHQIQLYLSCEFSEFPSIPIGIPFSEVLAWLDA